MNNLDYFHEALQVQYPGIKMPDYVWQDTGGDMPEMVQWPSADYGPFDLEAVLIIADGLLAAALIQAVKDEAGRRILDRYKLHEQLNMAMRAISLVRSGADSWTPAEAEEAAALDAAQSWILSVRHASDEIEAMQPIPDDFRDDAYWPPA